MPAHRRGKDFGATLPTVTSLLRELDHRRSDAIDVWLLWREDDGQVLVSVADEKTGDRFTIELREGDRALDVFEHPYAYAAWYGIDTRSEAQPVSFDDEPALPRPL
jgi:hypothetical protein